MFAAPALTARRASAEPAPKSKAAGERSARPARSNQVVLRELAAHGVVQRKCPGGCNDDPRVQPKLEVGAVDDPLEREADRVAEHVMRAPDPHPVVAPAITQLSRAAAHAEDDEPAEVPAAVHGVLGSSGRPLDPAARAFFEPRFGRDFGDVRIHDDGAAAASARSVNALAYTAGRDIAFGHGRYAPATGAGRALLAHELTHVVQQNGGANSLRRLQRVTHSAPTTPTNCHNWTIPLPPWIAGSIAHAQISATLGILPHMIPRATKAGGVLVGVPNPPAITPNGFADLWQRGAAVNVAEIKSTATGGTVAANEASHYMLRHTEWLTRQAGGTGDADDATYFASVGGLLPGGLLNLFGTTGTDMPLGTFAGDPGKQLHIEADPAGAMVYWCTGAGITGSPLWLPVLKALLDALKKKMDEAKKALQDAVVVVAHALAAIGRFLLRLLMALLALLLVVVCIALLVIAIACLLGATVTLGGTLVCTGASVAAMVEVFAGILLLLGISTPAAPAAAASLHRSLTATSPGAAAAPAEAESGADYDRDTPPATSVATASAAAAAYNPSDEFFTSIKPLTDTLSDPVAAAAAFSTGATTIPRSGLSRLNRAVAVLEQNGDGVTAAFVRTTIQDSGLNTPGALAALDTGGSGDSAVAAADTPTAPAADAPATPTATEPAASA